MPIAVRAAVTATLSLALLALGGCDKPQPSKSAAETRTAARERVLARKLQAACSSPSTYDRLKQVAFEEAVRIRNSDPVNLDTLATYSTVRMENPVVKSRDEVLDVTVCSGRFVLQLPPGAERAFAGERRLTADIEYGAQMAADGSGLVYQIKGAEPIIYKLAAFDLKRSAYQTAAADAGTQLAERDVTPGIVQAAPQEAATQPRPLASPERSEPPPPPRPPAPPIPPSPRPRAVAGDEREATSSSPSFNCRKASRRSERMVCASDRLASLDRAMSSLYYSVISDADSEIRAQLRRSRDRFLAWRDRCSNESCVAEAYQDRMAEIRDIAGGE